MNHRPVSQLTDIQRGHHGGDYGCAIRGDQVIDGSVTWPDTEILVDSSVLDLEIDLDLAPGSYSA
jgi:hypothetical protein